jgi:signal transduction histidine kinase
MDRIARDQDMTAAPGGAREAGLRLEQVCAATLAIASERSLPSLLQRIADVAREVTNARYAALGVVGEDGRLARFITSGISEEQRSRIGAPPHGHGFLGTMLRGTEPVRIARIQEDSRAAGFPAYHPTMTSFLGVPIFLEGRNLGDLYLADKENAPEFSEEDERLLQFLAAHAAIALDNAQRHERANTALAERVRELAEANDQLQRLTSLVISAQEEERRRIARELHDDTAQALTSVLVRARLLVRQARIDSVREGLLELLEQVTAAIDGVRRMALDLRPSTLDDLGLVPAVESYAREFSDRWGVPVRVHAHANGHRLPRDRELLVYRIIQEALTNIAKHAGATAVEIELDADREHVAATVRDNGRGFDPATTLASPERGLGLFGMQERAQLAGGTLQLQSRPGTGTTVSLAIPARQSEDADDDLGDAGR